MIQTIRTLVENTDSLYEKIVQCQKAGKYKLFFKNAIKSLLHFSLFPKTFDWIYLFNCKQPPCPIQQQKPKKQTKKKEYCSLGTYSNSEKNISNHRNQKSVELQLDFGNREHFIYGL